MNGFFFKRLPLGGDKEKPVFFCAKARETRKGKRKTLAQRRIRQKKWKKFKKRKFFLRLGIEKTKRI